MQETGETRLTYSGSPLPSQSEEYSREGVTRGKRDLHLHEIRNAEFGSGKAEDKRRPVL